MDEFATPAGIDWQGEIGMVRWAGQRENTALFYNKSVQNTAKSTEAGRPIYEDIVYVRIAPPGERHNIIDRPSRPEDHRRYPMQWAQFQQNQEQTVPGTPIDLLYPSQPSIASMLRASGVHTIEQCSELSGTAIDSLGMGAQQWVNDAQKYLEVAQKGIHHSQMKAELEDRDGKIRVLQQQIEILKGQVATLTAQTQAAPGMGQLFEMLAQMQRGAAPQFPPAGVQPTQQFDAQAAQIAALDPRNEMAQQARKRPGRPRKV